MDGPLERLEAAAGPCAGRHDERSRKRVWKSLKWMLERALITTDIVSGAASYLEQLVGGRSLSGSARTTLAFICVVLASKFLDDEPLDAGFSTKVLGLSRTSATRMEYYVLESLGWRMWLRPRDMRTPSISESDSESVSAGA